MCWGGSRSLCSLSSPRQEPADMSLAAFSPGWLNTEPEGAEMSGMWLPVSPLLLISQLATSELPCAPAGWDSTDSCLSGVHRLRCTKSAGAFAHVDDLVHAHALVGAETSAEIIGMTADNVKGVKFHHWKGMSPVSPSPCPFSSLIGSAIEVMLFSSKRRHDFMISTLFAENSLSFPFQPWHLARGHLIRRKPKPFCQHSVLVPH